MLNQNGHGGARNGAGRPAGLKNPQTLEREAVLREFRQRVLTQTDSLFNAQFTLAVGSIKVYRIDEEEGEGGKKKRVHVLVTDAEEIKSVLDEHEGGSGVVGESFYFVSDVLPDNRAIDSLMNRAFGKPTETLKAEIETNDVTKHSNQERADRILRLVKSSQAA